MFCRLAAILFALCAAVPSSYAAATLTVNPDQLSLNANAGSTKPVTATATLSNSGTAAAFTVSVTTSSGGNWLQVSPASGTAVAAGVALTITANPTGLPAGDYSGQVIITAGGSTATISVTFSVSGINISVSPGALSFSALAGKLAGTKAVSLNQLGGSGGTVTISAVTSSGGAWISLDKASATLNDIVNVTADAAGLLAGMYNGSVTVNCTGSPCQARTVSVTLVVQAPVTLNVSPASLALTAGAFATTPVSQNLQLTSTTGAQTFTAAASTSSGGGWLSVTQASASTPSAVTVIASARALAPGVYSGTVVISSPSGGANVSVAVSLTVAAVSNITVDQPNPVIRYCFCQLPAPGTQAIKVSSADGSDVFFTVSAVGGDWLSVSPQSGDTLTNNVITISVNPVNLSPNQTYRGTVTITPSNGAPAVTVTVTLILNGYSISVSKLTIPFTLTPGQKKSDDFEVDTIKGGSGETITLSPATSTGGSWLSVLGGAPAGQQKAAADTPIPIMVNAGTLPVGTYYGSVQVTCDNCNTKTVAVILTVAAGQDKPVITSVVSAGSHAAPGLTPGAWIEIYGTGLTHSTARTWNDADFAGLAGGLPTVLDDVRVLIDGKPASVYYISATQLDVQVPDDANTGPVNVVVKTGSNSSDPFSLNMATYAPSLFTFSGAPTYVAAQHANPTTTVAPTGAYPGSSPAHPSEVVVIYATGFGPTTPVTPAGQIVTSPRTIPLSAVSFTVGGLPAPVTYAGVTLAGVWQFNIQVPNLPPGDWLISGSAGGQTTQPNVYISVR